MFRKYQLQTMNFNMKKRGSNSPFARLTHHATSPGFGSRAGLTTKKERTQ
jgi:hypothetical protein